MENYTVQQCTAADVCLKHHSAISLDSSEIFMWHFGWAGKNKAHAPPGRFDTDPNYK